MRASRENAKSSFMRRVLACLVSAAMVVAFTPVVAWGEDGDKYLNWDASSKKLAEADFPTSYTLITSSNPPTTWGVGGTETWYVATGEVTIGTTDNHQRVTVNGNVHLILKDGCRLTVNGGIQVLDGDANRSNGSSLNSLTIYGQSTGADMGSLTAIGSIRCAGIGGNDGSNSYSWEGDSGPITIVGGMINAAGGYFGAGLGGGTRGNGTVTICGGTVIATGGSTGAGIGGGNLGTGTVTISGGTVTAAGGNMGAGIGGGNGNGDSEKGSSITISGGTVTATGGAADLSGNNAGAGIGSGSSSEKGSSITISGGTVKAIGKDGAAGIGGGWSASSGTFGTTGRGNAVVFASSISDQSGKEASASDPWSGVIFEGADYVENNGVTFEGVALTSFGISQSASDNPAATVGIDSDLTLSNGHSITIGSNAAVAVNSSKTLTNNGTIINRGAISGTVVGNPPLVPTSYVEANGTSQKPKYAIEVTASDTSWGTSGNETWYVANKVVPDCITIDSCVTVNGNVHLILADDCKLTVTDSITGADNSGSSLTIYGQSGSTGTLDVTGSVSGGSGPQGADGSSGGGITINGGVVTAQGSLIGGNGGADSMGSGHSGGGITINSGAARATSISGGNGGYSSGSNTGGSGGNVTINGGAVTVTQNISGGSGGNSEYTYSGGAGGNITINGGAVTVTQNISGGSGGNNYGGSAGTITIAGGTIETTNITGGHGGGNVGSVSITGGTVYVDGTLSTNSTVSDSGAVYYPLTLDGATVDSSIPGSNTSTLGDKTYGKADSMVSVKVERAGYSLNSLNVTDSNKTRIDTTEKEAGIYEFKMPSEAVAVTATWTINQYTITFMDGDTKYDSAIVNHGSTVAEPTDPTKTGYRFVGWCIDSDAMSPFDFSTTITENKTLYAKWKVNQYTIMFESNGGSDVASITQDYNTSVTLPKPTKTGYNFAGWSFYSSAPYQLVSEPYSMPANNIKLYAMWTVNSYDVKLNTNGGTINSGNVTSYTYGVGATLPTAQDISRSGYTFAGWYDNKDFTGEPVKEISADAVDDKEFWAKWNAVYMPPTYGVPATGEGGVAVKVTVSGSTAVVGEISASALEAAVAGSGEGCEPVTTITIDLSGLPKGVTQAQLSKTTVDKLLDVVSDEGNAVESVTVNLGGAVLSIDAKALAAIAEQVKGANVTLGVKESTADSLNSAQQQALSAYEVVELYFEAEIKSGSAVIHNINGGSVRVSVSFEPRPGHNPARYVVLYVGEDGQLERYATAWVDGMLSFKVPHFSAYAVVYVEDATAAAIDALEALPMAGELKTADAKAAVKAAKSALKQVSKLGEGQIALVDEALVANAENVIARGAKLIEKADKSAVKRVKSKSFSVKAGTSKSIAFKTKTSSAGTKVVYKKTSGSKYITVTKSGKITAKKGMRAGKKYTAKVKVTCGATTRHVKITVLAR